MTTPISFETCSSTLDKGDWISISSADLVLFLSSSLASLKPSPQTSPYSSLEKKKWFGVDTLTSSEGSLLFYWYPHTSAEQSTHIHADGEDHALCGRESLPCSSFNRTLSHPNANNKFMIDTAMTLKEGLTITADTILTSTASKQTITTTSAASIAIGQNSFTLLDLSLIGSSRTAPFLSLSSSGSLILNSCSFSSFSNTFNDGSVLSGVLGSTAKLEISDCTFEKCKSAGNGGVIAVDVCDLTTPSNLVLSSVSFGEAGTDEANLCGSGKLGQNVYVVSLPTQRPTLKHIFASVLPLKPANDAGFFSSSEMNRIEFGEKSSGVVSAIGSLLFVVFSYDGGDLTVDESSAITHSLCGHSFLPCSSLSTGYSFVKKHGETDGRLLVRGGVSLDATITTTDKTVTMTSTGEVETLSVGSGKYLWICGGSLTVSSLAFVNASESFDDTLFVLSGVGSLSLSECSFTGFSSTVKGSVISGDVGGGLEVSGCSFVSCSSSQNEGDWISITSADLVSFLASSLASLKPSPQTSPYSNLEKKKWFGVDTLTSSDGSLLFYWYPHTSAAQSTHIHADGEDHALCGRESLPCSSFNRTLSQRNTNCKFVVDSAMALEEGLTITADTILTSTTSKQTITSTSAASITVGQISLTLLDLSLTGSSRTSFISLSFASSVVLIGDCSFSSFTLSAALIDFTAGSLSLSSTKFHQIARSDGDGSVLEVEMIEGMELEVDDVELSDVTTQNGAANGFFISFIKITDHSTIPAFSLHNLKYSSSSSSNSEGAFVWIEGNDLDEWIAYGDARFTGSYDTGMSNEWLWTVDHATSLNVSLLFYLIAGSGAIGVATEGLDLEKCGHNSVWCRSLEHSLNRASTVLTTTLHVMREVSVENSVEMGGVTVKGLPVMSSIVLSSSGCLREETGDTVQFESLLFEIETEGRTQPVFCVTSGSLTLSSLSFVSSNTANVLSSQLIHSTAPISLTNVNVSSVSLSGVALIESWSDVLVDGCRFRSISRSTGLGSVIEANISVSTVIKILHTTFENCRSESTSTWILLKGVNTMASEVSSWEGTLSRSSDRNGVMVADSDESNLYSLIDILFPPAVSNVFVGGRGIDDLTSCGDESAPCRTISFGFEVGLIRKDSSETVAVSLIDQAGIGRCVWVGSESLLITAVIGRPRLVVEDDLEKDMDGSGVVNVEEGSVTLSDLTLLLPTFASPTTAVRPVSLIFGSGTVLFSNILVSQSSTQSVDLGLCWIVGGSLSLEQIRISQIEMSEDVCLIVAVSETKPLLCSIVESEITRTSTTNSALLVFSSSSPLSHCQILDCLFSHSTNTQRRTQSESAGSLLTISTKQADLSMEDTTFEECWMIPSSSAASILHVTVFTHPSHSVSTVRVIRCKFLSSQSASLPSSFILFSLHSPHACVLFEDSLFFESSKTNTNGGVLIEYGTGLPIVIRRRTVFKRCTVILSEIQAQSSNHKNLHDEL
ncbi:hypothetical protein BLNAU_7078 [Blattamonas nauphoetae]|uniref:Uncharacterized protein n=1 Tax=Blattamonas nauphoetae TaxID=2049346 RepID=A0ABQ9Y2D3_9EUKA|nr:hypothetical protein BLNAU_7078 [Blattamonas nauphoetae]